MKSVERIVKWLEERKAAYSFTDSGLKAKVLLGDNERLVRVVRGWKGNLVGRIKGSRKIVVFPEVFAEELTEGKTLACKLIEKDNFYIGIPLQVQHEPESGIHIFWIERP